MDNRFLLTAGLGYVATTAVVLCALWIMRGRVMASLGTDRATSQWQEWTAETARLSREATPFTRREQKAQEPPMLILLRDHFTAVAVSTLPAMTIFYWFLTAAIRGSLRTRSPAGEPDAKGAP